MEGDPRPREGLALGGGGGTGRAGCTLVGWKAAEVSFVSASGALK